MFLSNKMHFENVARGSSVQEHISSVSSWIENDFLVSKSSSLLFYISFRLFILSAVSLSYELMHDF